MSAEVEAALITYIFVTVIVHAASGAHALGITDISVPGSNRTWALISLGAMLWPLMLVGLMVYGLLIWFADLINQATDRDA